MTGRLVVALAAWLMLGAPVRAAEFQSMYESGDFARPELYLARCAGVGAYMARYLQSHHPAKSGMLKRVRRARAQYEAALLEQLKTAKGYEGLAAISHRDALVARMLSGYDSAFPIRKKTLRYPWQRDGALRTDMGICDEVARVSK